VKDIKTGDKVLYKNSLMNNEILTGTVHKIIKYVNENNKYFPLDNYSQIFVINGERILEQFIIGKIVEET